MGSDQKLSLNSQAIPVTEAGSYTLTVRAEIPSASAYSGYFALMSLGEKGEVGRAKIDFDVPAIGLPPAVTDRNGRWRISVPAGEFTAQCRYDGDDTHWPAEATLHSK